MKKLFVILIAVLLMFSVSVLAEDLFIWNVGTDSKKLEMANNNVPSSLIEGETIGDIRSFIDKEELSNLADGTWKIGELEYNYHQYLFFDFFSKKNEIVKYANNGWGFVNDYFYIKNGEQIARYKIEFEMPVESKIYDIDGLLNVSGTMLKDLEGSTLTLFGKEYTVVLAKRPQSEPEDSIQLTLMGGAVSGSLLEGESKTYEIDCNSYEVRLIYIDATYAKFEVKGDSIKNGDGELVVEKTAKLKVGETYLLVDGSEIGVSKVTYEEGLYSADFFLGAEQMILRDNDVTDTVGGIEMIVGAESIDGADVIIEGADDNVTFRIVSIVVNMTAQDDYFVGKDGKLNDVITAAGDEKEVLFTNNWDIEYKGLTDAEMHDIKLYSTTDRKYKLQFYDGDNNLVDMPLAYAYDDTHIILSEDSTEKALILKESIPIQKNDYFVITGGNLEDGTAKSYLLQYKGADKQSATSPKIQFKNLGTGETLEYAIDTSDTNNVGEIILGEQTFKVENATSKTSSDFRILVDLDATYRNEVPEQSADPIIGTLLEGESKDYYLGEQKYSVILSYVDSDEAKFVVNSESTSKLKVGETYILSDGNGINVSDILYQSFAGGVHSATFELIDNPIYSHLGIGEERVFIIDSYGAQITLQYNPSERLALLDSASLIISTPNANDYNDQAPSQISLVVDAVPTNKVTFGNLKLGDKAHALITPKGEINIAYGYTSMGGKLIYETPIDSPALFTYQYPQKQRLPQVSVISEGIEIVGCDSCTTPTNNMVITENTIFCPGTYNLVDGIEIGANDVMLDCNGAELNGSLIGDSYGIYVFQKSNVKIKNCRIRDYSNGIYILRSNSNSLENNQIAQSIFSGIDITGSGIPGDDANENYLFNNTLTQNNDGIFLGYSNHNLLINNLVTQNEEAGFRLWGSSYNNFSNNSATDNRETGFVIASGSNYNQFTNNEVAKNSNEGFSIALNSLNNTIEHNNIHTNNYYNLKNEQSADISVENNYWGTINPDEIAAGIYDFYDDNNLGAVNYCPYLDAPYPDGQPVECGIEEPVDGNKTEEIKQILSKKINSAIGIETVQEGNVCVVVPDGSERFYFDVKANNGNISVEPVEYCGEEKDFVIVFQSYEDFKNLEENYNLRKLILGSSNQYYFWPSKFAQNYKFVLNDEFKGKYCGLLAANVNNFTLFLLGLSDCNEYTKVDPKFNGDTIDFIQIENLSQATNVVLEIAGFGKIDFGDEVIDLKDTRGLKNFVIIEKGKIGIDNNILPSLTGKPATLTMYNLDFNSTPAILMDGLPCGNVCSNVAYNTETGELKFKVSHFTIFEVIESEEDLTPPVDLSINLLFNPQNPIVGDSLSVTAVIKNNGETANSYVIEYYTSSPQGGGGGFLPPTNIGPFETANIELHNFGEATSGSYSVFAIVYSEQEDSDLSNNIAAMAVNVEEEPDITPPIITITNPLNESNITENFTWLNVTTDEQAFCFFSVDGLVSNMMLTEDGKEHSYNLTDLKDNTAYDVKVSCQDLYGNFAEDSVMFSVNIPDQTPPEIAFNSPLDNTIYVNISSLPINLSLSEEGYCSVKYRGLMRWIYSSYKYYNPNSNEWEWINDDAYKINTDESNKIDILIDELDESYLKYFLTVTCTDSSNNTKTETITFGVRDNPLTLDEKSIDVKTLYLNQNFTADYYITSKYDTAEFSITIVRPDESIEQFNEYFLNANTNNEKISFSYEKTDLIGKYQITLLVTDTEGNTITSTDYFEVFEPVNQVVNLTIGDNELAGRYSDSDDNLVLAFGFLENLDEMGDDFEYIPPNTNRTKYLTLPNTDLDLTLNELDGDDSCTIRLFDVNFSNNPLLEIQHKIINKENLNSDELNFGLAKRYQPVTDGEIFNINGFTDSGKTYQMSCYPSPMMFNKKYYTFQIPYDFEKDALDYGNNVIHSSEFPEINYVPIKTTGTSLFVVVEDTEYVEEPQPPPQNNPPPSGGGGGGGGYLAQCNDKKDNDKDGLIDYPNDPGCSSKNDNDETNAALKSVEKAAVEEKEAAAVKKSSCTEDWICTLWSECADGKRTRSCSDQNSCRTYQDKPKEIDFCEAKEEAISPAESSGTGQAVGLFSKIKANWLPITIAAAAVLAVLGIIGWKVGAASAAVAGKKNSSKRKKK